jgi:hypothetical protein
MASLRDIVGGLNFPTFGADTDDLIRSAQTGNLGAYKELIRRGEMVPSPAREQGRHGRPGGPVLRSNRGPEGMGLSTMEAINHQDEAPSYLGSGLMNEAARGDPAAPPQGLPYMSAINPQQPEAPSYLGQNLMAGPTASRGDQTISNLAGGHDAAGVIQSGASAADEMSGVTSPADSLPAPIKSLVQAFEGNDQEAPDEYEQMAGKTIQDLLSNINPERNKNMALAQAGFAMAGSGSPYFLQGVGIGGQAGIKSYNEAQDRDMEARVRAGRLGTELSQNKEAKRAHRAGETIEVGRLQETARSNVSQEGLEAQRNAEAIRANKANEGINRAQLGISAQNASIAAGNLQIARDHLAFTQRQYQEGKAGDDELQKAQIEATKAQAEAAKAGMLDRNTDIQTAEDGTLMKLDLTTNTATPFIGSDGKPVKALPKSTGSKAFVAQYLAQAGRSQDYIADVLAGRKPITEKDAIETATRAAAGKAATVLDVTQQQAIYDETYKEVYGGLMGYAQQQTPAANTPPAKGAPSADQPPVPGAKRSPKDNNWYVPDPNRPGKYLRVE